jgi:hypothetical protein
MQIGHKIDKKDTTSANAEEMFNNMLSSVDESEHVIKQCFTTSFDLYRQLMDNIKHVIKQEKCYKTLHYTGCPRTAL